MQKRSGAAIAAPFVVSVSSMAGVRLIASVPIFDVGTGCLFDNAGSFARLARINLLSGMAG